jgi:hypothetical protein
MFVQSPRRRILLKLGLSLSIALCFTLEADAASKRRGTISAQPVAFAELFYLVNGTNNEYVKCLPKVPANRFSLPRSCMKVMFDLRSFARGFDYDDQPLTDTYTACRVLEALSRFYNKEDPYEPTRCNE